MHSRTCCDFLYLYPQNLIVNMWTLGWKWTYHCATAGIVCQEPMPRRHVLGVDDMSLMNSVLRQYHLVCALLIPVSGFSCTATAKAFKSFYTGTQQNCKDKMSDNRQAPSHMSNNEGQPSCWASSENTCPGQWTEGVPSRRQEGLLSDQGREASIKVR